MSAFMIPESWIPLIGSSGQFTYNAAGLDAYARFDTTTPAFVLSTATPTVGNVMHKTANCCILEAITQDLLWRIGANPTTTVAGDGMTLSVGSPLILENARDMMATIRFIQVAAGAILKASYFRVLS